MLTKDGFSLLLDTLIRVHADRDSQKSQLKASQYEAAGLRGDLGEMTKQRDAEIAKVANLSRDNQRLENERDRARREAGNFSILIVPELHVYIGFAGNYEVESAKDEAGDYLAVATGTDFLAFLSTPLQPRQYAAWGRLVRLPAAPTGKLQVGDDIPF